MNRKALLLACIIGMSTMLFSGCGNLDNNGGVTTRNADNGNTVRNLTNKRNNTMDVKRDGLMGRTAGRTDALGYRMMGTGNGMTGNGTTGMDMDSQLSSLGFENSLVIGNTIIVASGDQQGQTNGRIGMKNRINGTGNGGMGGTTGTGGMDGTTAMEVWAEQPV